MIKEDYNVKSVVYSFLNIVNKKGRSGNLNLCNQKTAMYFKGQICTKRSHFRNDMINLTWLKCWFLVCTIKIDQRQTAS